MHLIRRQLDIKKLAIFVLHVAGASFAWKATLLEAYHTTDSNSFPDATKSLGAPIPITRLGNTHYFIYRKSVQWRRAGEICASHKRKLATFKTTEDYEDLVNRIHYISNEYNRSSEFRINRRYWIGLNDLQKDDAWTWNNEDRPVVVNKWTRGKPPTKGRNNKHCVMLWNPLRSQHLWKEEDCTKKYYFLCEQ